MIHNYFQEHIAKEFKPPPLADKGLPINVTNCLLFAFVRIFLMLYFVVGVYAAVDLRKI